MTTRPPSSRATLAFAGTVLGVLATFRVLDIAVARLGQLPAAAYTESFFLDDLIARWWRLASTRVPWWFFVVGIVLAILVLALDQRRFGGAGRRRLMPLFAGWRDLEGGQALRWLVLGVSAVAAWTLSGYGRNLYFDRLHAADRLLIVVLCVGIAWRPLFVVPFAIAATAVAGQLVVPLGFISWTEMAVVLRIPVLFGAFWIVRAVTRRRESDVFIFAVCCLLAATYWTSGLGKLRVGWMSHPHVNLLLLGAYANGWLAFLEPKTIERASRIVASLAWPLMLFTLLVECGALVMLWRRWSIVGFLLLAPAFHLGAFALTGIFFWKWIVVEAMLLVYLMRDHRLVRLSIFTPGLFALSVIAIVASPIWAPSENLTWFDTPLTYTLELEGVDARGAAHALQAGFFRPYTEAIVLGVGGATSAHAKLTRGMGITMDRSTAEALEAARSPDEVFALEERRAPARADSAATAALDDFLRAYAANARCTRERDPVILRVVGVPRHLWTFPLDAALPCGVVLERIRVFERTTFFDGTALRVIRRILLRETRLRPG